MWLGLVFGAALGPAAGCGGSTSSGSGSGAVSRSGLPDALAQTICANVGPCCQAAGKPFDQGKCQIVLSQIYKSVLPQADGGAYDMAASGPCLDAVGAAAGKCDFGKDGTPPNASCSSLFGSSGRAKGKAGDACNATCTQNGSSTECWSFGSTPVSGQTDAAAPVTRVSCYSNEGIYCDKGKGVCQPQVGVGAGCSSDQACAGAWCKSGKCSPLLPEGGDCSTSSSACLAALYCDFAAGKCSKKKPDGAACQSASECETGSCRTQKCGAPSSSTSSFLSLACAG
jgi:hypothetical protein